MSKRQKTQLHFNPDRMTARDLKATAEVLRALMVDFDKLAELPHDERLIEVGFRVERLRDLFEIKV